jgi:hypothetical protein
LFLKAIRHSRPDQTVDPAAFERSCVLTTPGIGQFSTETAARRSMIFIVSMLTVVTFLMRSTM